tara:strand:- start:19 stop:411 length:393 start_codon:yes stop_codon:yes gene_type:complete
MKNSIPEKQLRKFGYLIGFGFPIIFGWILPIISDHNFRIWTLWISILFLVAGILKPRLLFYPYKIWIKIGNALGYINSRLILGLVYIFVLLPLALIMRTFKYDPLRKKKSSKKTYRETKKNHKINLTRIF